MRSIQGGPWVAWLALSLLLNSAAHAEPLAVRPSELPWGPAAADGTSFALIEGDRTQAAPFTYAFRTPADSWDAPHHHSQDARVFVAQGTLYLGYGRTADRSLLQAYPAGSILLVPAGVDHFDGSDRDTIIYGVASGPWETIYVDEGAATSAGTPTSEP